MLNSDKITVSTIINASPEEVWEYLTEQQYVEKWNYFRDDWKTSCIVNDFKLGGKFNYRLEAKDGNEGFNFTGVYKEINPFTHYGYTHADDRKVDIKLNNYGDKTEVIYEFDSNKSHTRQEQEERWATILENLNKFVETKL